MNNSIFTSNEKVVNAALGENNAKTILLNGSSVLEQEALSKYNDSVEQEAKRQEKYFTDVNKYAEEVNAKSKTIEIMPIGNYLLVKPFSENPFQKIVKTESGIILNIGGLRPEFENTDTGEIQEEEQFVLTGVVQEVGPDAKYVRPGDVVMYPNHRAVPVPFYRQGLITFNETAVIAVVAEGLTERFKKNAE